MCSNEHEAVFLLQIFSKLFILHMVNLGKQEAMSLRLEYTLDEAAMNFALLL